MELLGHLKNKVLSVRYFNYNSLTSNIIIKNSETLKEHKSHTEVLCKSPYFQRLISGEENFLIVDDPTTKLDKVIDFLYKKDINLDDCKPNELDKLLLASEYYELPDLQFAVFEKLANSSSGRDVYGDVIKNMNRSEIFKEGAVRFLAGNFGKMKSLFENGLSVKLLNVEMFNLILSSPDLNISGEDVIANAVLNYVTHNQSKISEKDLQLLFSQIRYNSLSVSLLVKYSKFLPHLPSEYQTVIIFKLYSIEKIPIPSSLPTQFSKRKYLGLEPLTFVPCQSTLSVALDEDNRSVVSKNGGGWWQNMVSDQKIQGSQKIFYKLNSCGTKYVGIGFGSKDYNIEENFLGQRSDGWSLCTSAGFSWDGHIFNGITSNEGQRYAPPELLREGATVRLDIDIDDGKAKWVIGDTELPVAWSNIKGKEVHVIVSMYMPGSSVTVWRE